MNVKIVAVGFSLLILIYVVDLIRRHKMTFQFALTWLVTSVAVLFFALFDTPLRVVSTLFGFKLPSNFIFFLVAIFMILLSLLLTIYINEQNRRSEILAQSIAMLEFKIKQLENKSSLKSK